MCLYIVMIHDLTKLNITKIGTIQTCHIFVALSTPRGGTIPNKCKYKQGVPTPHEKWKNSKQKLYAAIILLTN